MRTALKLLTLFDSRATEVVRTFRQLIDEQGGIYFPMQEQSGTMLDVYNKYRALSPNLALNGGFDQDTNWTKGTGITIASGVASFNVASSQNINQTPGLITIGKTYRVTFTVLNYASGFVRCNIGNDGTNRSANGTYTQDIVAANTVITITSVGTSVFDIDNVSVQEVDSRYGRNIVLTPDFASDTNWSKSTGVTIASGVSSFAAVTAGGGLTQTLPMTVGKYYLTLITVKNYSTGSVRIDLGGSGSGTARSANGTYAEIIRCTPDTLLRVVAAATFTGDLDNVFIYEINIPDSEPSFGTQLLADGDMEAAGTAAYTADNGATLSKQSGSVFGSGSQILRVAGAASASARQAVLVAGKVYRTFGYARGDGTRQPAILGVGATVTLLASTNWQYFEFSGLATQANFDLRCVGNGYVEFDDVRVVEDVQILSGNRLQDSDMEQAGVTWWTAANSATVTKETGTPLQGAQVLRIARNGVNDPRVSQSILIIGKTYRIRGTYRSDGNALPRISLGATTLITGTNSTSSQAVETVFVASAVDLRFAAITSTGTQYAEFDGFTVEEVSPMVGVISGTLLSQPGIGGAASHKFDGVNDYDDIYTLTFNSAFNPLAGTLIVLGKLTPGVLTDGTNDEFIRLFVDASNFLILRKPTTNNVLDFFYVAGGTTETLQPAFTSTNWFLMAMPFSKADDKVEYLLNGAEVGADATALGTFVGNFSTSQTVLGAQNNAGAGGMNGWLAGVLCLAAPLTNVRLAQLARDLNLGAL